MPNVDMLSLPVLVAWLRANWLKIILGGVVLALIAIPLALMKARVYESTATLLVFPPGFQDGTTTIVTRDPSTEFESVAAMTPRQLPVEMYETIAFSPALLSRVIEEIPLENTSVQGLRWRLRLEQPSSRASQSTPYSQPLTFHAKAGTPELAARMAQTWAEQFKAQVDEVAVQGVGETFSLLEALHTDTRSELEQADRALAEHRKAWNLDLIKAQLQAKQKQYTEFERLLKQTEVDLASSRMQVEVLEGELAEEPQKYIYFRAPSDDAYWITAAESGGKPQVQPDQGLRSEEPNESYVEIRGMLAEAKEELGGHEAAREAVLIKLQELMGEISSLTTTFAEQTVERDRLTRESESLKASYAVVRTSYEKGRVAERTLASNITVLGTAEVPNAPSGPGHVKTVYLAGVVGMIVTAGLLFLKEISDAAVFPGGRPSGHTDQPSGPSSETREENS